MKTQFNSANTALPACDDPEHPLFGHGGSYRFDAITGKTTLLERSGQVTTPKSIFAAPQPDPTQQSAVAQE